MNITTLAVGAVAGVFIGDFIQQKFGDKLGSLPGGGKLVTAAGVIAGVKLAQKFMP
jgi:uncharacterized protein YneF (UPF0154 family)